MTKDLSELKVLLAEDTAVMRKIEIKALASLGITQVVQAVDGADAVSKLKTISDINLVISDWNMPNQDGYELLKWIKNTHEFKSLPFIMATGQGESKREKMAVDAGVSGFVSKPFNADDLRVAIQQALGMSRPVDKKAKSAEKKLEVGKSGKLSLHIAHIQITDHLVLGVMQDMIRKKEVAPEHFDLTLKCMPGWNPVRAALETGEVDAACVLAPIAMDLFGAGTPIRLVLLSHRSGSICVRNRNGNYSAGYREFFKGKTFLVPHKLSIHYMLSHMFFRNIGLSPGMVGEDGVDVFIEVAAPVDMPRFMSESPDTRGYIVAEPLGTKAIASQIADLQFLSGEIWKNHPCCVLAIRNEVIDQHPDAVYELTRMMAHAGRMMEKKPEAAAEASIGFLDPHGKLGLKAPVIKKVLTEPLGLRCSDLYPLKEDFDKMQRYMHDEMGIGSIVDLDRLMDLRFAERACKEGGHRPLSSVLHTDPRIFQDILNRTVEKGKADTRSMLNREGKYLTFQLADQMFAVDIMKIREIIGLMDIRSVPRMPEYIRGVINLRDKVIPIMDLRMRFGMGKIEFSQQSCIVILDLEERGHRFSMGIAVDSVSEVIDIKASDIEAPPRFGMEGRAAHIMGMAKQEGSVRMLLDIDHLVESIS